MTSTAGCSAATTFFGGMASPNAGETSPAQTGLTLVALAGIGVEVAAKPSVALMLRNVSDSLPSSAATLIFSACSGVTSNVTVRPKLLPALVGLASGASTASTRRLSTTVSLTERRVNGGAGLKVWG